ncbi:MAG: DUF6776 family protein [Pseudomonadota bacterium]
MLSFPRHRRHPRIRVPRPSIRQPNHWLAPLVVLLVLAGTAYLTWNSYDLGRQRAGFDSERARQLRYELKARIEEMESLNSDLRQQVATLERAAQVDKESIDQVQDMLVGIQGERHALEEDIAFLRSLLSDGKSRAGLRIREFKLVPLDEPGVYRYRFSLSKVPQSNSTLSGTVDFRVAGRAEGEEREFGVKELVEKKDRPVRVKFKNLVQVEGTLSMPVGFIPERVTVAVASGQDDVVGAEAAYPWNPLP